MICPGCWRPGAGLCGICAGELARAPVRLVGDFLVVRAGYVHTGLAKHLVHDLKYRAMRGRAELLAGVMTGNLPAEAGALVPVPRSIVRRLRLGVDPALELALAVGRKAGLPVIGALMPPLWQAHHAGKGREGRSPVSFLTRRPARPGTVIVDDVVTTGSTLVAAHRALGDGVIGAVTATSAGV